MPGPAPKPADQVRRRNAPAANTLKLPAEGRVGDTPPWPFGDEVPTTWTELWRTPQAAAWERLGWNRVVARYVHILTLCESPETMTAALLGEARQMEDRLGLTPMAMLRLRWEVSADEMAAKRTGQSAAAATKTRRRLKVADDAVAGS